MLIRNAELKGARVDVRIDNGFVAAIAPALAPAAAETVVDARGGALLPGLHDHHLHLLALAASLDSVQCGPPQVNDAAALEQALRAKAAVLVQQRSSAWIRGIGYHDAVAGSIDRVWLDRAVPDIPVRIQHRSGRLWILNSRALALLGDGPLEKIDGVASGRLYDADPWLRSRLGATVPDLRAASALLTGYGITGITEVTPHNSLATRNLLAAAQARGDVVQDICLMGDASLDSLRDDARITRGARKIHLHESQLPAFETLCAEIETSHRAKRPVAIHCVTLGELLFSLSALETVGSMAGDRIEHAAVAPPDVLPMLRKLGLTVVTQPNFIWERGEQYLREVDAQDRPWLYRARGFLDAGIPLAGGTDAPFGNCNPWRAMQAAVDRRTRDGAMIGVDEALTPERALALFTTAAHAPGGEVRRVEVSAPADLCWLDRGWASARSDLAATVVNGVVKGGELVLWRR